MALSNSSNNIFSDETETEKAPPSIDLDIVPNESFARISLVTSNDTWRKKSAMANDVSEGNVPYVYEWLCGASRIPTGQWVQHASWTTTTWLFLLLGTDINVPPDWVVDFDVGVGNVCDLTT